MNIEEFREYCLSFDGVTEKMPFGKFARRYDSLLVFYVLDHMFCFIDIDDFTYVNLRSEVEEIAALRAQYSSLRVPINRTLKQWVQLDFDGDIPEQVIYEKVAQAYDIIKDKYSRPKRKRGDSGKG